MAEIDTSAEAVERLARFIRTQCACALGANAEQPVAGTIRALAAERDRLAARVRALEAQMADRAPRVKPLVWQRAPEGFPYDWQAWCGLMGGYYLATSEGAKREHEAVRAARILAALDL